MTDTQLLNTAIRRSGLRRGAIAEDMGLTPEGLRRKVYGLNEFKQSEIVKLVQLLDLTTEEREQIFFCTAS